MTDVTQADRDAAADFYDCPQFKDLSDGCRNGFMDDDELSLVQAFARRSEASIAPYVEALRRLTNAVKALPVEDMIESDQHGEFELVGYCMQAQGEWDAVTQELAQIDALLENG